MKCYAKTFFSSNLFQKLNRAHCQFVHGIQTLHKYNIINNIHFHMYSLWLYYVKFITIRWFIDGFVDNFSWLLNICASFKMLGLTGDSFSGTLGSTAFSKKLFLVMQLKERWIAISSSDKSLIRLYMRRAASFLANRLVFPMPIHKHFNYYTDYNLIQWSSTQSFHLLI